MNDDVVRVRLVEKACPVTVLLGVVAGVPITTIGWRILPVLVEVEAGSPTGREEESDLP